MNISYHWLKSFVDFDASPEEIAAILTKLGHEVEEIEPVKRHLKGVKIGKILSSEPHQNADKLKVTRVDTGESVVTIVCGAPNCRTGLLVPVALPGTRLGDFKVDTRSLRGILSEGIILSEKEMGITDDHSGILELPDTLSVGSEMISLLPQEDWIMKFEVTVNRPDVLSHLGMAREVAAFFDSELHFPEIELEEIDDPCTNHVGVEIVAGDDGPRYVARMVRGVTVQHSPLWMRALLHSLGQRPINNIVDITNYVLLELGHPLHAFDRRLIDQDKIIVRLAKDKEQFVTLDGQMRILTPRDLLIADPVKGIALAGIMGGENSEVRDDSSDILIEAAYFNPVTVRKTAKRLGLFTEASRRFERGADPSMAPVAAKRCAQLISEYAGGEILKGEVDQYTKKIYPVEVSIRPARAAHVLGMEIPATTVRDSLERLQLEVEDESEKSLRVTVPTFRPDLEREIDLIEEIARIVGYNEIPSATRSHVVLNSPDSPLEQLNDAAADVLVGLGFREVITSGMISTEDQSAFLKQSRPFLIEHPINPEMNSYRTSLVPGLLRVIEHNINHGIKDVHIFEIGQCGGKGWLAEEEGQRLHLAVAVTGKAVPPSYDRAASSFDFYDLKGIIEQTLRGLSLDNTSSYSYDTVGNLEIGLTLKSSESEYLLVGGLLTNTVSGHFGIELPVYVFEADLERYLKFAGGDSRLPGALSRFRDFSRFPASERDLAFIVPGDVPADSIMQAIRQSAGQLLEDVSLFDLYTGKPLAESERSLAYHLVFRADDRTLTDDEVDREIKRIVNQVKLLPGVQLRV